MFRTKVKKSPAARYTDDTDEDEEESFGVIGEIEKDSLLERSRNVSRIDVVTSGGRSNRSHVNIVDADPVQGSSSCCKRWGTCITVVALIFAIMALSTLESAEIVFVSIICVIAFAFALQLGDVAADGGAPEDGRRRRQERPRKRESRRERR